MYDKLDEEIIEVCKDLMQRDKAIFTEYQLEAFAAASNVVSRVQRMYRKRGDYEPSKMTIMRHIHKLSKNGRLQLEERPPIDIKVLYIKLPRVKAQE